MSAAKALLVVLLALALAYAALVSLVYFSQRALLYPGASAAAHPAHPAWGEAVFVRTPDGETLYALHSAAEANGPTLLFFLGNADWVGNYRFLADALRARGIGLLAISYRGYAGSTGFPTETGLLTDGLAAYDWLSARSQGPVVVLGQSLGSGVAVNTAAERPAAGVILVSAYASIGRATSLSVPAGTPADQGPLPLRPLDCKGETAEAFHSRTARQHHPAPLWPDALRASA